MIDYEEVAADIKRIARELVTIRQLCSEAVNDMRNAEVEIPEFMRRFANYMHDLHDIRYIYDELGHDVPKWVLQELERTDDRLRQLLEKLHTDGGSFEKIRREMASDPLNRWDHTRQLSKPKENGSETGKS